MTSMMTVGSEIMTDMQFKAIIEMVMQIVNRSTDIEDVRRALLEIKGEAAAGDPKD